ncbi:glycosyltransferase family 4 protein [Knoellia remsis]|uniref:glycosyltransferase family 4 protein n=1 Tax=Knoellia remsis TaxID=407159 RepID=UPI001FEBBB87|nr:glycosyltransferase family 4 protein [Knoellia remsis]
MRSSLRIAFLSWRDSTHPEGGGAEHYIETIGELLTGRGHEVTIYCAAHPGANPHEVRRGVTYRRQGGRFGVYPRNLAALRRDERKHGSYDAVVDVQNGVPFFSTLATRSPVVLLCHHVHREQWPIVFGPLVSRIGWFVESQISPRFYRGRPYVAVSDETRRELAELGVDADDVTVVHNGTDVPRALGVERAPDPTLVVLGRLVPHKRVEHAIDVLARLRPDFPHLSLRVVGHGWWHDRIAEHAERSGVSDAVHLLGFVDEDTKHVELARSWVGLAPSVKEGWGLCVVEAASHGVPTVAYSHAGGLSDSIVDGRTGLLVRDLDEMTRAVRRLLVDEPLRSTMARAATAHAAAYTWPAATDSWEDLLQHLSSSDDARMTTAP